VFEEAINDEKWRIIMDEEIASIEKNNTWKLVPRTKEKKLIGVKLIYKEKKMSKEKKRGTRRDWKKKAIIKSKELITIKFLL
jgi:hypothetical protein